MRTRYENANIVDASGERTGALVVENGVISADTAGRCEAIVDLGGLTLLPAFVDTHCHLRDPGWPQKETMESGMLAALKGGYCALCAMANTQPVCDSAEKVISNHARAGSLKLCRLVQAGAAGVGLGDDIPADYAALSAVTNVISNDGNTILNDRFMEQLLRASDKYGFIVSTHCQPERAIVKRDIELLRHTGGRLHIGHISRRETVEVIRAAKAEGLPVTCEAMPHHLFSWDNGYRVNPPIRTHEDVLALIEGVRDGTVDCLATDHAPHTPADKAAGAAGISNIEHAAAIFNRVFQDNGLPLTLMSRLMSANPAKLMGIGTGLLRAGERADIVVFDPGAEWTIETDGMRSRSRNTPFEGRKVSGRVLMTIIEGDIRYDNRQAL